MCKGSGVSLLALLAAGCSTESRLWRINPFSSSGSSERFNGFPLVYADRGASAVLWPLMDFDRRGFAVRPLVSKDGPEWDFLFPLSHIDTRSGEGWVLNGYSFDDNVGLFPLCNFGPDLNFVGPAWWHEHGGDVDQWGLFPLAQVDRRDGDGWFLTGYSYGGNLGLFPLCNFGPDFNYVGPAWWTHASGDTEASFGLFPLFTKSPLRTIGPVWWEKPDADGNAGYGCFPLVWGESDGSQLTVLPLYHHHREPDHELHALLLPPTWWENRGDEQHHVVLPFYASFADANDSHWFTPLANGWHTGEESGLNVYPLYWSSTGPETSQQMVAPFYLYRERGAERLLLTPLGGRGWDASGATSFVNVLGPLYHHSLGPETETTAVLWPLFEHERVADTTGTRVFPLFDTTTTPTSSDTWMVAGLSRLVTEADASSFRLWPLFAESNAAETPDLLFDLSLFGRHVHGEQWSHHLFPLYGASGDQQQSSYTGLAGLGRVATTQAGSAWRLWPLASSSTAASADGWIDDTTLFRHVERGEVTRDRLFPLYAGEHGPDHSRDELLLSLVRHERTSEGSAWRLWPLVSTTGSDTLHDFVDSCTLIGVHSHTDETQVHVGTPLVFNLDLHHNDDPTWNVRVLTFLQFGYQERQIVTAGSSGAAGAPEPSEVPEPFDAPGSSEEVVTDSPSLAKRSYAGLLFDWFLYENTVVESPTGESREDAHYRLPLLHEYERTADKTEWDALLYAVHSVDTPDEELFSVLGYAYRSDRKGETTTRDVFPFITWDSAPDSSHFSFLWHLYRYERRGERVGGNLLFIPWGDAD